MTQRRVKVATIGFFDGVHRGHQYLIRQVVDEAQRRGGIPVAVTFSNHPRSVLRSETEIQLLSTCEEKERLLRHYGIQEVRMLEFTGELARQSAREFMSHTLRGEIGVDVLVIGYDHRFGYDRREGFDDYVRYGMEMGMEVVRARVYEQNSVTVSSSLIRSELLRGKVADVKELLGYGYSVGGVVTSGFQIGRKIGYPTANIRVDGHKIIPCDGVYAVRVMVDGTFYGGMLNIGCRPTFDNGRRSVEVNLFDFSGDIYNERLRVYFVAFMRHERKFGTVDEFITQLSHDERQAKDLISASGGLSTPV